MGAQSMMRTLRVWQVRPVLLLGLGLVCAPVTATAAPTQAHANYPTRLEASLHTLAANPSMLHRARAAFGIFPGSGEEAWKENRELLNRARAALVRAFQEDADPTVRLVAAWTLGHAVGETSVAPLLTETVRQHEATGESTYSFGFAEVPATVFFSSFRGIGERGGDALRNFLLERLTHTDPVIRMAAASCFETHWRNDPDVQARLEEAWSQERSLDARRYFNGVLAARRRR